MLEPEGAGAISLVVPNTDAHKAASVLLLYEKKGAEYSPASS